MKIISSKIQLKNLKGFTLLELMVVVTIVAIATATIVLSLPDNDDTILEKEAQRLSALLESARSQSRIIGTDVYWKPNEHGFEITGLSLPDKKIDLPHDWLDKEDNFKIQMFNNDRTVSSINLGPEPMLAPQRIEISLGKYTAKVKTDGLAPFDYEMINSQ